MELRNRYLVIFLKFYRVVTKSMFRSADENVKYGWIYQGGVEDLSRMKSSENQLYYLYSTNSSIIRNFVWKYFSTRIDTFSFYSSYFYILFIFDITFEIFIIYTQYFNDSLRFFYSPWILFNISRFSLWIFDELFNNPFYHFHLVVN